MCSERAYTQEKRGTQFGSLPEDFKEEVLQLGFAGLNRSFTGNEEKRTYQDRCLHKSMAMAVLFEATVTVQEWAVSLR